MPEDEEEVRVEMLTSIAGTKDFGPKPWRGFCFNIGTVQSVPRWKAEQWINNGIAKEAGPSVKEMLAALLARGGPAPGNETEQRESTSPDEGSAASEQVESSKKFKPSDHGGKELCLVVSWTKYWKRLGKRGKLKALASMLEHKAAISYENEFRTPLAACRTFCLPRC